MPCTCRVSQVFHWLVSDRVEYLETTPAGSRLQHIRIVAFMLLLLVGTSSFAYIVQVCSILLYHANVLPEHSQSAVMRMQVIDAAFLQLTVSKTLQRSASVHLLFAFEYVIQVRCRPAPALHQLHACMHAANQQVTADRLNTLKTVQASVVLSTAGKYTLAMIDAAMEGRWAGKGTYVFYLELVTDMLHLFVYLIFFTIVFANYGLPLHLVRPGHPRHNMVTCKIHNSPAL